MGNNDSLLEGFKDKKILIIDDSPTQLLLLKETLEKNHMAVATAKDGIEGLEKLAKEVPDLVISDIEMPRLNGYGFCKKVKLDDQYKNLPIILLTNLTDPLDVIQGMDCGADGFLTKPFETHLLFSTIRNTIKNISLKNLIPNEELSFFFSGKVHTFTVNRVQITNLLLSIYSSAVQKNLELEKAYRTLNHLNEELESKNRKLNELNEQLIKKQSELDADLMAAALIQRSFLPQPNFKIKGLEFASLWQPANPLGGDIFNIISCAQDKLVIYMADVSGHDVPSALVTISISQFLHQKNSNRHSILTPQQMMIDLDTEYPMERFNRYFTIFYLVLDIQAEKVSYSCSGHPPAILLPKNKTLKLLDRGGTIIGLNQNLPYEEGIETICPGDKILLYTDGVTETKNKENELFGLERLCLLLDKIKHEPCDKIVAKIQDSLQTFSDSAPSKDDVSIMCLEFKKN